MQSISSLDDTSKISDIFIQEETIENRALWEAVKAGDIDGLKDALTKGANPNFITSSDEGRPSPLHETVRTNDGGSVRALLEHGACANMKTIDTKNTPLHVAASNGNEKICRLLINALNDGSKYEKEIPNAYGNTPLFSAVRAGNVDIVRLLLENGYDVNTRNHLGSSLLHICCFLTITSEEKQDESLQSVLDDNKNKNNALVLQPHQQIAAILLSNQNFKLIDEKDENGHTPLHISAQRGHDEMVKLLVDSGADISIRTTVDSKGRGGRTAHGMAKFAGKMKTCKLLKDIEQKKDSFVSGQLATDLQSGYSIRNPIVGAGGLGVRRMSSNQNKLTN